MPVVGDDRAGTLVAAWRERLAEADVVAWLDEQGFEARLALKAVRFWGEGVLRRIRENPYVLIAVAPWARVDAAARHLGFGTGHDHRLVAAVEAVLYRRLEQQHTWTPRDAILTGVASLLGSGPGVAARAVRMAEAEGAAIPQGEGLQPAGAHVMERYVADRLAGMQTSSGMDDLLVGRAAIQRGLDALPPDAMAGLTEEQGAAVRRLLLNPLALLLGGAGTGKTTTLRVLGDLAEHLGLTVHQMALSGRAAARMREATGRHATTIASFLGAAARGEVTASTGPLLVVDEASMLDLPLLYRILRAVGEGYRLVLVGDPYQLPPIGFGLTFHLLANQPAVPKAALLQVHRQAQATGIPDVAADIRTGLVPLLRAWRTGTTRGVTVLACAQDEILDAVTDVLADLGRAGGEMQVLSPVRAGAGGVAAINRHLHKIHAVGRQRVPERQLAVGDPILWTRNDYRRELWNGSLGRVVEVTSKGGIQAEFDGRVHAIDSGELGDVDLAYGLTVHKSQGTGFERVVVVVPHGARVDRTMIYTAVTRGVRQIVIVGDLNAVRASITQPPASHVREVGLNGLLKAAHGLDPKGR
ncbi:exonuclease V [Roseomonas nepalensis]|uniref:Exonuclease V n=1 Tax=Muricoccus nepalensis TaxID=1854500 RepID=A0A502G2M8_9PROT|nr:AAA family ATPase [Roseomonas nepalensis]TPG55486.1 exonuclease V [Roseomonas nepalensis]